MSGEPLPMSYFQQYQSRKAEIEKARLHAFSSQGRYARICGLIVEHLTAEAWIDLRCDGNGLLAGIPPAEDVRKYLFRVCKGFPLGQIQRARIEWKLWRIWKDPQKRGELECQILAHIESAFDEVPESMSSGGFSRSNKIAEVEGIVSAIDELAARYGQAPQDVAKMPLRQIFSLQKAARLSTIPGYKILEPRALREIKSEHLKAKNGQS